MINRAALLLKYKPCAIKWINDADPYDDNPGINIDLANEDRTVYLIREEEAETPGNLKVWVELNYEALFENELHGWYTDQSLWPKNRTLKLFYEWFEIECHTVLIDTLDEPIEDDEI